MSLRPSSARLWRQPGAVITAAGAAAIALIWLGLLPTAEPGDRLGEMLGVEAIWLMSWAVLAVSDRRSSTWLNGIGGQLWWHRVAGALGLVAAIVHPRVMATHGSLSATVGAMSLLEKLSILLVLWAFLAPNSRIASWRGPLGWIARRSYDRWRILHGVLAIYVGFALYHGFDSGRLTRSSMVLTAVYLLVAAFGAWVLVDQMVLRRFRNRTPGGTVTRIVREGRELVLWVRPDVADARPGEFVYLGVRASKERPVPLTVAGSDADGLEFVISVAGEGTRRLVEAIGLGERVSLSRAQQAGPSAPYGQSNVWVAGGSGITPMLGALRTMSAPDGQVTLIWTRRGNPPAVLAAELDELQRSRPWLRVRLVDTLTSPRISAAGILAAGEVPTDELHVRLCGPAPMVDELYAALTAAGVPADHLEVETFAFR